MTRKRLLIALALLAGLALALPLGLSRTWLFGGPRRITAGSFGRIELGMTRAEALALLGDESEPLVDLGGGRHRAYYAENRGSSPGREATIALVLDADDWVVDRAFEEEAFIAWCERMWRTVTGRR
jgi:hypothetical protein